MTRRAALLVHGPAAVLACWGLGHTLWHGAADPRAALAFGALIAVGEAVRDPAGRDGAPLAAAGALGYALLGAAGGPAAHGVPQTLAVVLAGSLAGLVPYLARGGGPVLDPLARRVLTAGFAAACAQPLCALGGLGIWGADGPVCPLMLLPLPVLTALCDAVLAAALTGARTGRPYGPLLREEVRALPGVGTAVGATGVVLAPAVAAAGPWALPVAGLPLLLTQYAVRRCAAARATCRQTIASLARATELAGCAPPGHARRVAALSRAVGRELGLRQPELDAVEHAALLHDIGRLALPDPPPGGAPAPLRPAERRRVALLGAAVARRTGAPPEVAVIVERQADPYRRQPVAARIVRTADAYDDLVAGGGPGGGPAALEALRLATARDHEPRVVEALGRVLARGGPAERGGPVD
ncbi:metal-dependent phosphohydrolase [Streptomyces sp. NRRL F-4489]|uniref:HD-GYP domain-containing protein n=1 Tax=Streptomyces sp. NRRL F-4489 TaxID=1609095 RepID=UPI0007464902|nr:HD domain-containing protein [Streptomyces sp. NRRL F-4489]KUL53307.1 metal-dependent phosphohydrolase [Streptomyces sp. NRRL F-4489]